VIQILTAVAGAAFGALLTGFLKIVADWLSVRRNRIALARGFVAEIRAGLHEIPDAPPEEEAQFLASHGLPYKFYKGNTDKIGLLGMAGAEKVVSYYSLRWQLYAVSQASGNSKRVQELLSATRAAGSAAVDTLQKS
jgi:hypothetical protein